jgi:type II secretion system protein H
MSDETMTTERHAPRNQPGFTLVEVMVTLGILAIAAALVSPAIMSMAPSMALKSAVQNLYSDIQRAKSLAVKENRDVGVRVGTAGYTVGEPFTDANGDGLFAAEVYTDTDGNGAYTLEKEVVFATAYEYGIGLGTGNIATADWNNASCGTAGNPCNTPDAAITFNSRGIAVDADSAFLEITPPPLPSPPKDYHNYCYAVTVVMAGSVQLRKYNGADPFAATNWVQ